MDKIVREVLTNKMGALMVANAELVAQNAVLGQHAKTQQEEITRLKARVEMLEQAAKEPRLPLLDKGEGDEANGAGVH